MDHRGRRLLTVVDLCAVVILCLLVWNGQLTSADSMHQRHRAVGLPVDRTTLNEQVTNIQQLFPDAVPPHVLHRKQQDSDFRLRDRADEALTKSTGTFPADVAIVRQMPHGGAQSDVFGQLLRQQQVAFSPNIDETDDYVEDGRTKKKVHFGFHAMRGRRSSRTRN